MVTVACALDRVGDRLETKPIEPFLRRFVTNRFKTFRKSGKLANCLSQC